MFLRKLWRPGNLSDNLCKKFPVAERYVVIVGANYTVFSTFVEFNTVSSGERGISFTRTSIKVEGLHHYQVPRPTIPRCVHTDRL
jgi:hypothetical protein